MAYMHKMLKPIINRIKNLLNNYVYRQQFSYLMKFKCNFHFMPVYTFKLVAFQQL